MPITINPEKAAAIQLAGARIGLKALITHAQEEMSGAPLPVKYRRQIWQLEAETDVSFSRGDIPAVVDAIQEFSLPTDDPDLTQDQRDQVAAFKAQMLALFSP